MHVKKSKELDDNSPTKNDTKDAKVIAQFIKDGQYSVPNLFDRIYAELRECVKVRDQLTAQLMINEGRIENVIQRFRCIWRLGRKNSTLYVKAVSIPYRNQRNDTRMVLEKWKLFVQRGVGILKGRRSL